MIPVKEASDYFSAIKQMQVPISHGAVYLISNLENGKHYVGQTTQKFYFARGVQHLEEARRGSPRPLCRAIRKYGDWAFKFEILAWCDDQKSLDATEDFYIRLYNSLSPNGYNFKLGGGRGKYGEDFRKRFKEIHNSPETKELHRKVTKNSWETSDRRERIKKAWEAKRPAILQAKLLRDVEREAERLRKRPERIARRNEAIRLSHQSPVVQERIGAGTRGGRWIYKGDVSRRLKAGETLPVGWSYGRGNTHGRR